MIYPKMLNEKEVIKIISPSNGITKEKKLSDLSNCIKKLNKYGFVVEEDLYTRKSEKGSSAIGVDRAKELLKNIKDNNVNCLLLVSGGDFLIELFDYCNLDSIKNNVKWIQGHSDVTNLLYFITTYYDISTIYSFNACAIGSDIEKKQIEDNINFLKGNLIVQELVDNKKFHFDNINLTGRIIGGCLDSLLDIVGTKYDFTNSFINKYKNDGIIWYFDIADLSNESIYRGLWQLKNAGWFKNTKAILFGKLKQEISYTKIAFDESIQRALFDLDVIIITNVNIGHIYPRITIINGSLAHIKDDNGILKIGFDLK